MRKCYILFVFLLSGGLFAQEREIMLDGVFWNDSAGYYFNNNQLEKGIKALENISKNDSLYCSSLVSRSYYLLQLDKYEKSLELFSEKEKAFCEEKAESIYINKAVAHIALEQYDLGMAEIEKGLSGFPKSYLLWYNKGRVLRAQKKLHQAVLALQESIRCNPYHRSNYLLLGDIYYQNRQFAQSLLYYNLGLLADPDHERAARLVLYYNRISFRQNKNLADPEVSLPDTNAEMDRINRILDAKIALRKDYPLPSNIDIAYTKQNHALLQLLQDYKSKEPTFLQQKIIPLFQWIAKTQDFEKFTYTLCYKIDNEKYQKFIEEKQEEVSGFVNDFYVKMETLFGELELLADGRVRSAHYTDEGYLSGIGYKKNGSFVGPWTFYTEDGLLLSKGSFSQEEKRHGAWTWYFPDGSVEQTVNYNNGDLVGEFASFYRGGRPKVKTTYVDGKLDGNYLYYNEAGALLYDRQYRKGMLHGNYKENFLIGDGHVLYDAVYEKDSIASVFREYYLHGKLYREMPYKNGRKHGQRKTYFADGKIRETVGFKEGEFDGQFQIFYGDGTLEEQGQYVAGSAEGEWKEYFPNAKTKSVSYYEKGKLHGPYKEYRLDGSLYYEFTYRKGLLIAYVFFDKNGKRWSEGKKKGGEFFYKGMGPNGEVKTEGLYDVKGGKIGEWSYYDDQGTLEERGMYKEGMVHGVYKTYYKNGALRSEGAYVQDTLQGKYVQYHKNKAIDEIGGFLDGNRNAWWFSYYPDGVLKGKTYYHRGNAHGEETLYREDGSLMKQYYYRNGGLLKEVHYDMVGKKINEIDFEKLKPHQKLQSGGLHPKAKTIFDSKYAMWHGPYISYDYRGEIQMAGDLLMENKQGKWQWFEDGYLETEANYVLDELHGTYQNFHPNGKLRNDRKFRYGKEEGEWLSYYENGALRSKSFVVDDKLHGKRYFYDRSGNLQLIRFYEYGRLIGYSYADADKQEKPMIAVENETAKIRSFYHNGQLARELEYYKGGLHNEYKTYSIDGVLLGHSQYRFNDEHGFEKEYFDDGKLRFEGHYAHGKKHGTFVWYQSNGKPEKLKTYKFGLLSGKTVYYDENGKVKTTLWFSNDEVYKVVQ
ncbi:MAG: hypothetical protein OIF50_14125 [Flavobacteriaceae bacterium]|nr:hypothetical protein [Flavobacteriaceae bacterium]